MLTLTEQSHIFILYSATNTEILTKLYHIVLTQVIVTGDVIHSTLFQDL